MTSAVKVRGGTVGSFTIPTDAPEADGTFAWDSTTLVVVELDCGDVRGFGYTYSHRATVVVARELIEKCVVGSDVGETNAIFSRMRQRERNYGTQGIAACAVSAVDMALWDAKAKLCGQPLCKVLGMMREAVPVYGSGGFTTYTKEQMRAQMDGWVSQGIPRVKMKIGTHPEQDVERVRFVREVVVEKTEVFVDANGAYSRKQALAFADVFAREFGVSWFEEPVSSDDLAGLRLLRDEGPAGMDIAAGEYGWDAMYLKRMIDAGAVDVIQADATRCGGVTGFMDAAAIADATPIPLSAHCGPTAHLHLGCAARPLRHVEYFHDHERIEGMLFDGFRAAEGGVMRPDLSRAGIGVEFKRKDAERFRDDV
jgi:L-alanine-DL-glutamate epimerase-like enolase superfamily enzyme